MNRLQLIVFNLILSLAFGDFISPNDGDVFNFTHILFEWEQEPDSHTYNIVVFNDDDEIKL